MADAEDIGEGAADALDVEASNVDVSLGGITALTADVLYGEPASTPPTADAPATKPDAKPEGSTATGEAKPPEATKPDAAAKPDAVTPPWDKQRQKADQENANLRRENEQLRTQLAAAASRGEPPPDIDVETELDGIDSELEGIGKELDTLKTPEEEDDPTAQVQHAKRVQALLGRQNKLQARQAKLQRTIARGQLELSEASQHERNVAAYNAIINTVCAEVGEEHRNAILQEMVNLWERRGYNEQTYPTPDQVEDAAFAVGRRLALQAGKKAPANAPKGKPPVSDIGVGGAPAAARIPTGQSLDAAVDAMMKEGKFRS